MLRTVFLTVICLTSMVLFQATLCAQNNAEKTDGKGNANDGPVSGSLQFQMIRTDGSEIYLMKDVRDPNKKQQVVTQEVEVPYAIFIEKDGKRESVTKLHTETRTQLTNPTIRKSIIATNNYKFKTLDRKSMSKVELIGRLGMGRGIMVVQVFPKQKIPEAIKRQLSKDTIIMEYEPRNR